MNLLRIALLFLLLSPLGRAQWKTTTYSLKGGWNAIYLNGDAPPTAVEDLFPSSVLEVWRWNPNPSQVQFTESPLIPSAGTAEWSVWRRGLPAESSLARLIGQSAYLVKCSGTAANSYSAALKLSPSPPANSWVRNGANLLGFPTLRSGSTYPTMAAYFATFPVAIAAGSKVYKYVGGDLGAGNPLQVFSPNTERLDATQAYWFSAEVAGNFVAPIEISPATADGISLGRSGSFVTVRIRNRSAAAVTLTFSPEASEAAPAGQTVVAGMVPLTRRTFNAVSLQWTETAFASSFTEAIGPQGSLELSFGINRAASAMTAAAADALFASFVRVTDSGNLMDVLLPVTAQKSSLAGLWIGDVSLTNVSNKVSNAAQASAALSDGAVSSLNVIGSGGFGYTSPPLVTIAAPHANGNLTAKASAVIDAAGTVVSLTPLAPGSNYDSVPDVSIALPTATATATATAATSAGRVTSITRTAAGGFYTEAPTVTIAAPPSSVTASGTATLSEGKSIAGIELENGGSYYTTPPVVTIAAPTPSTATGTAIISAAGTITGITLGAAGANYLTAPAVTIAEPVRVTATGTALVSAAKTISGITPVTGGGYYIAAPTVTLGAPTPSITGTATAAVSAGAVSGITLGTAGTNYDTAPSVTIAAPPVSAPATGTAVLSATKTLSGINVGVAGGYYTVAPTVSVALPTASVTATGTATVSAGAVSGITRGTAGTNYTTAPSVTIAPPPASVRATGTASIGAGKVSSIAVNTAGSYYTAAPAVTVSAPGSFGTNNTVLNTAAASTGADILHTGTLVVANHFGSGPQAAITLANGLTFGGSAAQFSAGGGFNASNAAGVATITNVPFSTLVNSRIWIAYANSVSTLTIPDLTVGQVYRLQLISTSPANSLVTVEGNPAVTWTGTNSILTVTWTAADTTGNVTLTRAGGEIYLNGYALHNVTSLMTTATATATLSGGAVTGFTMVNQGAGYTNVPTVTIADPSAPVQAVATSTLSGDGVASFSVTTAGSGYPSAPTVTVDAAPAAIRARATANLTNGAVSGYTITNAGSNYTSIPPVTISGGTLQTPVTAGATSTVNGGGLAGFTITNPGAGYTTVPAVTLGSPPDAIQATAVAAIAEGRVTGYSITNAGTNYTSVPSVRVSDGTFRNRVTATATSTLGSDGVASFTVTGAGSGYTTAPVVTVAAPPPGVQATATANITNGLVTGFNIINPGTLYNSSPLVSIAAPPTPVQALATCVLNGGLGAASGVGPVFTLTEAGVGYPSAPVVTIADPPGMVPARARASLTNGTVSGYTVTNPGSGYMSPPTVTISAPPANSQATAMAVVENGSVTGFTVTGGGSGYQQTPTVTIAPPPLQSGTATASRFKLRTLLHVSDDGVASLLPQVFSGQLAVAPHDVGLSFREGALKQDSLASAQRYSAAHLPLDQPITDGSGSVAIGGVLTRTVTVEFNDPTNPFVHAYHPDHDNKDARGAPLAEGVEASDIIRSCKFTFTAQPPAGSGSAIGWGSSVIGGTYEETMTGVYKDPLILSGTFELRRASDIGTLSP